MQIIIFFPEIVGYSLNILNTLTLRHCLEHKEKVAIIIDLGAQKENYTINLDMKDEQATLTLPLLFYACSPTLETKSNASVPKESQSTS